MGMNQTPSSERVHIGLFGKRNTGKSSMINALTGQSLAVVSEVKGTTTDPVSKAMELLPLGPVVLIDTPGLDEADDDATPAGELGRLRVQKSYQTLNKTDIALIVTDAVTGMTAADRQLEELIKKKRIPYLIVYNKADQLEDRVSVSPQPHEMYVSAADGYQIAELRARIAAIVPQEETKLRIVGDLISPGDFVVLVVPIDKAAPKGRLILPQQQTIRDILEADATAIVVKEYELRDTLATLGKKPRLVITDSQVFTKAAADTPPDIPLTSFSILFARYKGELEAAVRSVRAVDKLADGDQILIAEGCTHHRQCDDIGTVKIPRWLKQYTGKELRFDFTSGQEFPLDLSPYKLIIHCGGCTLNEREMKYRIRCGADQGIPFTNYGILIAYLQGILKRSVEVFPHIAMSLENE